MTVEFNPSFTFDSFVVGPSNRLAVAAAHTVSQTPGQSYNPLFIYGRTGLGKSHLLVAIGQRTRQLHPALNLIYYTLDTFVEGYHAAVSSGALAQFRADFLSRDVVLLDDVQFLSHSKELQEELLRLAGEFQASEKQLVLTSDRTPAEIENLDDRLLTQIGGGLVIDVGLPEFETRLAILQARAAERNANLSPEVLAAVAEIEVDHTRALLGLLNRLQSFQAVSERQLSPDEARSLVLGEKPVEEGDIPPAGAALGGAEVPPVDEFGDFLLGLQATVTQQVEGWNNAIRQAVKTWSDRGYGTGPLDELLRQEVPGPADAAIRAYQETVERLKAMEIEIGQFDPDAAHDPVFKMPGRLAEAEELLRNARYNFAPPQGPSETFTLDAFQLGSANRVAVEAARAVIEQPGTRYNPLVIVAPPGVGKTHLLNAVGCLLRAQTGTVACVSTQTFVSELADAVEQNAVSRWRARYRQASALLLDDIDAVGGQDQTQEELFNLFNIFLTAGRQMVFTARVPPREIQGIEDRIQSRLAEGLVAMMDAPDPELCRAVVASHLQSRLGVADTELVEFLAGRAGESIAGLVSLVQRVLSGAEALDVKPSVDSARKMLDGGAPSQTQTGARASSAKLVAPGPGGEVRNAEKIVWAWPDPLERVIEELV